MYPAYRMHRLEANISYIEPRKCCILTSVDSDEHVQPPLKLTDSKRCPVSSLHPDSIQATSKGSEQTVYLRRLIWGLCWSLEISCHGSIIFFRGIGRKVGRSLTWLILGMPLIWFGKTSEMFWIETICKLWKQVVERERERERENERLALAYKSLVISKNIMYRCWKWYLEILLVRIGFCVTKSDIRQYWCFACFLSHAQMFPEFHSDLNCDNVFFFF